MVNVVNGLSNIWKENYYLLIVIYIFIFQRIESRKGRELEFYRGEISKYYFNQVIKFKVNYGEL